jgi:excisionase family DNA binding protein
MAHESARPPEGKHFTLAETCQLLGISRATAMRWLRSGKLAAVMVGGIWRIPEAEVEKRCVYKIVRHAALPVVTGPLSETEVERITDDVAHGLRALGAPVRKDGLRAVVNGRVPVDALLWRFIHRAFLAQNISPGLSEDDLVSLSNEWDRYKEGSGPHPWTGEQSAGPNRSTEDAGAKSPGMMKKSRRTAGARASSKARRRRGK